MGQRTRSTAALVRDSLLRASRSVTIVAVLAAVLLGTSGGADAGYGYLASRQEATVFILDTATAAYVGRTGEEFRPGSHAAIDASGSAVGVAATNVHLPLGGLLTQPTLKLLDTSSMFYASHIALTTAQLGAGDLQGSLALHPSGSVAYVGLVPASSVAVIDVAGGTAIARTDGFTGGPRAMAVHPAGTFLYVTGDDTLSVMETTTNTIVKTLPVTSAGPVAVRPDGAFVYVVSAVSLAVVRTSDHAIVGSIGLPCAPTAVASAPDGARLYVAHGGCSYLSVVETAAARVTGSIPLPIETDGVDVDPTGTTIVAVHSGGVGSTAFVVFVDAERETVVRTVGLTSPVFPPLGKFLGPPLPPARRPLLNESPLPPAPTTRSRLVRTLYDSALGRAATDGEVEAWLTFLRSQDAGAGLAALVKGVLASEEMLGLPVSSPVLARLLYVAALGREPETGAVPPWSAVIAAPVAAMVPAFIGSPEFRATGGALPPGVLVGRLYQELLGRAPSLRESAATIDYLARTGDAAGVVRVFVLSGEYLAQPRSPEDHVTGLYRALLGRAPDPASLPAWVDFLAAERAAIVEQFASNPEFAARLATVVE